MKLEDNEVFITVRCQHCKKQTRYKVKIEETDYELIN